MTRNFNLIWWFWVSEKEIAQKKLSVTDIIDRYYNMWIWEFFVWYTPEYWYSKYAFSVSPNWRFWENEQISSYETLKKSIDYIHTLKRQSDWKPCECILTINWWYYNDITMDLAKRIIQEAIEIWVDWFMVWSYEILQYLSEIKFTWRIHISTILNVYNEYSIRFFIEYCKKNNLDLHRVVLPREVTIKELETLVQKFPDTYFEVFWQWDYCRYANWNCFAEHKYFSRDLCTFVLKHWLETKKRIRYDFKKLILDENLSDKEKEDLMNPNLDYSWKENKEEQILELINHMFSSNTMTQNKNNAFDLVYEYLLNKVVFESESVDERIINKLYDEIRKELYMNIYKYIYDWLQSESNFHNQNVEKSLNLFNLYLKIETDNYKKDQIQEKVNIIKQLIREWKQCFESEIKERWAFWLETYYKFMLYNRTATPFFWLFNSYKNIQVVKIPLRWRDAIATKLWLDLVDDAINNPNKYINDIKTISWKYFHYDINCLENYLKSE